MLLKNVVGCGLCRWGHARAFSTSVLRQERELFVRDERVHINLGTIGPSQHGKTSLVSVLTKVLNKSHGVPIKEVADIDNGAGERSSGMTQNPSHIEMWRDGFRFSVTDLPGGLSYFRNLYTHLSELDACLLVINPEEGVIQEMVDMYNISCHFGNLTIPVISTRSLDPETVDLVLMELDEVGLGEHQPIVLQSPLSGDPTATIDNFFQQLEQKIKKPVRDEAGGLYFPLEQVGAIPSRGTFCAGRVKTGHVKVGSQIHAFFNGQIAKGTVKDIEIFRKKAESLECGDRGGAFIKLKPDIELKRGGVLYDPGCGGMVGSDWRIKIKMLPGHNPVQIKGEYMMFQSTFSSGQVRLEEGEVGGDLVETILHALTPFMARPNQPLLLRSNHIFFIGHLVAPTE